MKYRSQWMVGILLSLGMLLGACAPAATPAPAEPVAAPVEEVKAPDPAAAPVVATEADLDAAINTFLAGMKGYNALRMEPFVEMLTQDPAPFLLDVRELSEVEENGYIPGAVLIPVRELGDHLDLLPAFDQPIVSYCGSGWRCTIAMTALGTLGWQDVLSLKDNSFGGYQEAGYEVTTGLPTQAASLDAAQPDPNMLLVVDEMLSGLPEGWGAIPAEDLATELAENPELILIDVRTQAEIDENGSIEAENALAIPIEEFVSRRAEWPAASESIVTYCGSGHRSTIAMTILRTYGYTDVRGLKGGLSAWLQAGYPKVGGAPDLDAAYTAFLGGMVKYNTIGLAALNEQEASDAPPFLLDVRQPDEVEKNGHIEGTVLIPLRELMQNLDLLPSFETPIVSYCGSGWRCTIAMTGLGALGWTDVTALKENSFGGWVSAGYPVVAGLPPAAEPLNAASPDPAMVALLDSVFSSIPEGWGAITVEQLAAELVENPDLILIDVRTAAEVAENGVIESPLQFNIPLEDFITRQAEWPTNLDAPIVTYCGTGHRCTIAMSILWSYGYTNVRSLKGGMGAWVEAGYPVAQVATP